MVKCNYLQIQNYRKENQMKKKLALLLAVVLVLSSLVGLSVVSVGAEAESTTPSLEITHFNVTTTANVALLFAVPADGYTTDSNVSLLVWESGKAGSAYGKADAQANGEILTPAGVQTIDGEKYLIFSYSGLSASQMTEVVYARVLYTDASGFRHYGTLYDYSIAEYASSYLNKDGVKYKALVEAMLAYGDDVEARFSKTPAQSYKASDAKDLCKVTVIAKIGDKVISEQVTQLAKKGTTLTLAAPFVDGAVLSSWDAPVTDGKITVNGDVTLTANYDYKTIVSMDYDPSKYTVGAWLGTTGAGTITANKSISLYTNAPENAVSGTKYYYNGKASGSTSAPGNHNPSFFLGTDSSMSEGQNRGSATKPNFKPTYSKWEVCGDGTNNYIKYAHNGSGQVTTSPQIVTNSLTTKNGIGDTISTTIEIDLMAGKDGKFPKTFFRFYKLSNGQNPVFMTIKDDKILLGDGSLKGVNGYSNVIATGSADSFTTVAVTVDFANGLLKGYVKDANGNATLTAVTALPANLTAEALYATVDGTQTIAVIINGGYGADNIDNFEDFKANKVDVTGDGVVDDKDKVYDEASGLWNYDIISKYVDDNFYFYFDNIKVSCGSTYE